MTTIEDIRKKSDELAKMLAEYQALPQKASCPLEEGKRVKFYFDGEGEKPLVELVKYITYGFISVRDNATGIGEGMYPNAIIIEIPYDTGASLERARALIKAYGGSD